MKTLIKYELIKIFSSRLASVVLLIAFIISFGVSGFNAIQYKSGEKGYYKIGDDETVNDIIYLVFEGFHVLYLFL